MLRAALLGAANNRGLARFVTKHGRRLGAYRFVAGETLDAFLLVVRDVNDRGMRVAAGLLGEDVLDRGAAAAVAAEYRRVLDSFAAIGIPILEAYGQSENIIPTASNLPKVGAAVSQSSAG